MILTQATIEDYKKHTEYRIASRAQYRLDNTWYDTTIDRKERMNDGKVAVYVPVYPKGTSAVTLTGVRLYNDLTGEIWAEKTGINIRIEGANRSVLYRFTFDIKESEV